MGSLTEEQVQAGTPDWLVAMPFLMRDCTQACELVEELKDLSDHKDVQDSLRTSDHWVETFHKEKCDNLQALAAKQHDEDQMQLTIHQLQHSLSLSAAIYKEKASIVKNYHLASDLEDSRAAEDVLNPETAANIHSQHESVAGLVELFKRQAPVGVAQHVTPSEVCTALMHTATDSSIQEQLIQFIDQLLREQVQLEHHCQAITRQLEHSQQATVALEKHVDANYDLYVADRAAVLVKAQETIAQVHAAYRASRDEHLAEVAELNQRHAIESAELRSACETTTRERDSATRALKERQARDADTAELLEALPVLRSEVHASQLHAAALEATLNTLQAEYVELKTAVAEERKDMTQQLSTHNEETAASLKVVPGLQADLHAAQLNAAKAEASLKTLEGFHIDLKAALKKERAESTQKSKEASAHNHIVPALQTELREAQLRAATSEASLKTLETAHADLKEHLKKMDDQSQRSSARYDATVAELQQQVQAMKETRTAPNKRPPAKAPAQHKLNKATTSNSNAQAVPPLPEDKAGPSGRTLNSPDDWLFEDEAVADSPYQVRRPDDSDSLFSQELEHEDALKLVATLANDLDSTPLLAAAGSNPGESLQKHAPHNSSPTSRSQSPAPRKKAKKAANAVKVAPAKKPSPQRKPANAARKNAKPSKVALAKQQKAAKRTADAVLDSSDETVKLATETSRPQRSLRSSNDTLWFKAAEEPATTADQNVEEHAQPDATTGNDTANKPVKTGRQLRHATRSQPQDDRVGDATVTGEDESDEAVDVVEKKPAGVTKKASAQAEGNGSAPSAVEPTNENDEDEHTHASVPVEPRSAFKRPRHTANKVVAGAESGPANGDVAGDEDESFAKKSDNGTRSRGREGMKTALQQRSEHTDTGNKGVSGNPLRGGRVALAGRVTKGGSQVVKGTRSGMTSTETGFLAALSKNPKAVLTSKVAKAANTGRDSSTAVSWSHQLTSKADEQRRTGQGRRKVNNSGTGSMTATNVKQPYCVPPTNFMFPNGIKVPHLGSKVNL